MAERYLVEPEYGAPYSISRVQAESRLVDLREQGAQVAGDLEAGFAYTAAWPSYAGRVRVVPVTSQESGGADH